MDSLIENIGLLCLAIDSGEENKIGGRTKLQKMIYFSKYLDWDAGEYKLHYYGPFSFGIADTLKTAKSSGLINENASILPYYYSLTDTGSTFLSKFVEDVCDRRKVKKTKTLFKFLSDWSKEELELAATIDYVDKNSPKLGKKTLLSKVEMIKENFSSQSIEHAYDKWVTLKRTIPTL